MLLIGEHELGGLPGISDEEGRTQFGMWSLLAAPLIMGSAQHANSLVCCLLERASRRHGQTPPEE